MGVVLKGWRYDGLDKYVKMIYICCWDYWTKVFVVKFSALIRHKVYSTPPSFSIGTKHIHAMKAFLSEKRTCMELYTNQTSYKKMRLWI